MTVVGNLLLALAGSTALPGARCRGRWALFDPPEHGDNPAVTEQRHQQAIGLCQRCTALASCTEWFDSLPKAKRPAGVIAGRVRKPHRPKGTPA